ncbi:hypothetical protein [Curvivirga sp.]|uniref:hypothetical protein n=1 Tax=Curvivirga sp. TaxID=2856848 RepID=UPI003B5A7269
MSTITSIMDTGFAPWSMTTPTSESGSSSQSGAEVFSLSDISSKPRQSSQVASLGVKKDDLKTPASVNPYASSGTGRPEDRDNLALSKNVKSEDPLGPLDILDIINPLQHIPGVGAVYREITGDDISTPSRIAGGTLYGGIVGFAASVVNSIIDEESGKDVGEHFFALFSDDTRSANQNVAQSDVEAEKVDTSLIKETVPTQIASISANEPTISQTQKSLAENPSVKSAEGELADKLASIPTASGGLAMTHMPGAILNDPKSVAEAASLNSNAQQAMPLNREVSFKPLSKDISRQLDRINQLNNQHAVLQVQEESNPSPVVEKKPIKQQAAANATQITQDQAAKLAAYQNAQTMGQPASSEQVVDISNAMMQALQKYDALLNGN